MEQWSGPFRAMLVSNLSQIGRVAGDCIDNVFLQSVLLFPKIDDTLLFTLGRGGGGGEKVTDLSG